MIKFLLVMVLAIAGLPVLAQMTSDAGVPQQESTQQTTAFTPSMTVPSASASALAMIKRFGPMYANTSYLSWGTSDSIQNALVNAEYLLVVVPGGTRGRNIWHCPTHRKVEVAFENYTVPVGGRTAVLICDQLFFESCGNLFVTAWRPVQPVQPQPPQPVVQTPPCKPPFEGGMRVAVIEPWCLETIGLDRPTVAVQKPLPTKEQQAVIINRLCFAKTGLTPDRMPYWQKGPVMEWRLGALFMTRCPVDGGTTNGCGHWDGPGPIPDPPVPY